jgi:hypothetical protein
MVGWGAVLGRRGAARAEVKPRKVKLTTLIIQE